MKNLFFTSLLLIALIRLLPVFAQESIGAKYTADEGQIKLAAQVSQNHVPLNRTVEFTIRVEWTGALDRYQMRPFENPQVTNFEILGNSSTNRVGTGAGQNIAVQEFTYTLKPQQLGMGYIESIIIRYTDMASDQEYRLMTNRIEVKIIDPLPEPGSKAWLIWLGGILVLAGCAVAIVLHIARKKSSARLSRELESGAQKTIEEQYLEELSETISLDDPHQDVSANLSKLSRLLRKFLAVKFHVPGLEATTDEVLTALENLPLDDRFRHEIREVLLTADLAKFSGSHANKTDLEKSYTAVEMNLLRCQRGEIPLHS